MREDGASVDEPALRAAWRAMVGERLPGVAKARGWPIHLDHCFARVLLDNACGAPWRTSIRPPAWRNAPREVLSRALALGEAALAGEVQMATLNQRSLALRGKRGPLTRAFGPRATAATVRR